MIINEHSISLFKYHASGGTLATQSWVENKG